MSFDDLSPAHIVRPIVPLDENVRENGLNDAARLVLVEDDHAIDRPESRDNNRAIHLRVYRPSGPLLRVTEESLFNPTINASPWARANSRYLTWPR